jgi:penicillin-binding protein 1C
LRLLATETAGRLGPRQSLAMVLADAATGEILASVGSTGHLDTGRAGAIDMTRATRSPGSTLKPFIYGLAFEDALVAPETLIDDTPADFAGYRPRNFDRGYMGEVSIREALQFSLNVPAVRLLEAVGPQRLLSRFRRGGIQLELPPGGMPGLAIGLGGAGVSLRDLVQLYSAFANNGTARMLRDGTETEPSRLLDQQVMAADAAWRVAEILSGVTAPRGAPRIAIAYKTGTSYGYRDAWAIGFDGRHVLGVWVGRPMPPLFQAFRGSRPQRHCFSRPLCAAGWIAWIFRKLLPACRSGNATACRMPSRSSAAPIRWRMRPPEAASHRRSSIRRRARAWRSDPAGQGR